MVHLKIACFQDRSESPFIHFHVTFSGSKTLECAKNCPTKQDSRKHNQEKCRYCLFFWGGGHLQNSIQIFGQHLHPNPNINVAADFLLSSWWRKANSIVDRQRDYNTLVVWKHGFFKPNFSSFFEHEKQREDGEVFQIFVGCLYLDDLDIHADLVWVFNWCCWFLYSIQILIC